MFGKTALFNLGNLLGVGALNLQKFSIPFTCFAVIGIINAVNMMDGVDGLTGGVSLIECFILLVLSNHIGLTGSCMILTSVLGGIVAFLFFNFPSRLSSKYKIFLGDAGSMFIGLTLAWACVRITQCDNGYPPALMLWVMALPLMDAIYLIINRKMRGFSPFRADRRHMHHILLNLGYSPKQTTLIMMAFSLLMNLLGVFLYLRATPDWLLFYGFIAVFLLYASVSYMLKKRIVARKMGVFNHMQPFRI